MTLETFFEKFDLFADAPDAVTKMRGLVRHLAVTGKLVGQDKRDEPVINLLDQIADHKASRGNGQSREKVSIAPITSGKSSVRLPESWVWVRFGDIVINRDGERIPVSKEVRATKAKTYDYYGASGVIDKIDGYLFDRPLLLIGEDGANLINRSTPIAFIARGRYWVNNHAHVLDGISEDFLRYLELHINAISLEAYVTGSAQPKMNQAKMNSIPIALPPLAEQKRIVAKVDELMALCDRLEAQQQEREARHATLARAALTRFADAPTPANLQLLFHPSYAIAAADLRQTVLTLAVQGKLVPQDPRDEPAEQTIRSLPPQPQPARFDRRSNASIQGIAALSVGPTQRPVPPGWVCVPLVRIARLESGHTPSRSRPDWWGGDVSWVGLVDARLHNGKTIFETLQHTNEDGLANSAARLLPSGTVCVSRTASVGYVTILGKPMATSQDFVNWVPSKAVTPDWLQLVFTSEKDGFSRFSKGAVHQTIYYPEWLSMHAMLPPVAEQHRIVARVKELLAMVDELEAQLSASRAAAANLLSAVVAELTSTGQRA